MAKYKVPVTVTSIASLSVKANTIEEAKAIVSQMAKDGTLKLEGEIRAYTAGKAVLVDDDFVEEIDPVETVEYEIIKITPLGKEGKA